MNLLHPTWHIVFVFVNRQTFSEEIQSGQTVRLIFQGQLLQDDNTSLSDLNVTHNCVVHCHLSRGVAPSTVRQDVQEADIDLGRFMIPLFTSILGFVWYLRWQYRYMFNATSTLSLVGVTTLFVLAVLASWRGWFIVVFSPMSHEITTLHIVSWPVLARSGLVPRTQALMLSAAECGFNTQSWHSCSWVGHLTIIASQKVVKVYHSAQPARLL